MFNPQWSPWTYELTSLLNDVYVLKIFHRPEGQEDKPKLVAYHSVTGPTVVQGLLISLYCYSPVAAVELVKMARRGVVLKGRISEVVMQAYQAEQPTIEPTSLELESHVG